MLFLSYFLVPVTHVIQYGPIFILFSKLNCIKYVILTTLIPSPRLPAQRLLLRIQLPLLLSIISRALERVLLDFILVIIDFLTL